MNTQELLEFRKELVDLKNKFDSRLKNNTIY
jgi:predicted component of type VI protein secretion system